MELVQILTDIMFPMCTVSIISGFMLAEAIATLLDVVCRSHAEVLVNLPPKVPKAVLLAPTITMPAENC